MLLDIQDPALSPNTLKMIVEKMPYPSIINLCLTSKFGRSVYDACGDAALYRLAVVKVHQFRERVGDLSFNHFPLDMLKSLQSGVRLGVVLDNDEWFQQLLEENIRLWPILNRNGPYVFQ